MACMGLELYAALKVEFNDAKGKPIRGPQNPGPRMQIFIGKVLVRRVWLRYATYLTSWASCLFDTSKDRYRGERLP